VRESFARQAAMHTLGIHLAGVSPGEVVLELPFRDDLTQQHGFLHAGVVTIAMDSACGYSALTLMEPGAAVLSVEFKVNLLAPARGRRFRAIGRVIRAGRTITVTSGELWAFEGDEVAERAGDQGSFGALVAVLTGTMMTVRDRAGLVD
jgi:uncharacterized protein (TIGR00369 family)